MGSRRRAAVSSSDRSQAGAAPLWGQCCWFLPAAARQPEDSCLSALIIIVPGARLTPVSLQGVEQVGVSEKSQTAAV